MADGRPTRDWRAAAAAAPGAQSGSKVPVFVAALVAGALLGAIVGFWFWLGGDPWPRFVSIPLYDFTSPAWPPVPFAEADAARLAAHFEEHEIASSDQEKERFTRKLASLESIKDRPLILHITGLAVAREGQLYLLSSRAGPGSPDENWHPIDDIFNAVRNCPANHKLLILDVARPVADPDCGVLADQAGALLHTRLKDLAAEKKLPALVLVSAGPGELSQVMDEEGATAFAHFLDEGLKGAADNEGDRDGRVNVRELTNYTAARVSRWAYYARGAVQTPYLMGDGDFRLTAQIRPYVAEPGEIKLSAYPKSLSAAWAQRDAWDDGGRVIAPHLLRRLERGLLRTESRLAAGAAEEKVANETDDLRLGLDPGWQKYHTVTPPPAYSLVNIKRPPSLDILLEVWLDKKPMEIGKFREAAGKSEPKPGAPEILAVIWDKLRNVPLSREQIEALATEALPAGNPPKIEHAEAALLVVARDLAKAKIFASGSGRDWHKEGQNGAAEALHAAFQAEQAIREAIAAATPESFRWCRSRLDELAKLRAEAEALLIRLGDNLLPNARTTAEEALNRFKKVAADAEAVRNDARLAADAYKELVNGLAELPGFAELLVRLDPAAARDGFKNWADAVDATVALADAFAKDAVFPRELLQSQLTKLREALSGLRARMAALLKEKPQSAVAVALLATPRLRAAERADYWAKWKKVAADNAKWLQENEGKTLPLAAAPPDGDAAAEAGRAARRARIGIDLARLAGIAVGPLNDEYTTLANNPDPAAWDPLASKLFAVLAPAEDAAGSGTDRIGRVFGTTDAPARMAAELRANFWGWLADRYDNEGKVRGSGATAFYREAANKTREAAGRARAAAAP